ncbi:hypothetical protein, partial [Bacillus subtilis]|uniref:hypothetical protein n=1 Tax=Bacillus subtilis TaxID=1423 RepID=UPI00295E964C
MTHNFLDHRSPLVGASLLANAVAHSTFKLADSPLSRASPLPQGVGVVYRSGVERATIASTSSPR